MATIAEVKERKESILDVSMSHITARNGSDALAETS